MRKITKQAVVAFLTGKTFHNGNTVVYGKDNFIYLTLHGNKIARWNLETEKIHISNCGWETTTTKERLNGLLEELYMEKIYQKGFVWYRGKEEFPCGQWVALKMEKK